MSYCRRVIAGAPWALFFLVMVSLMAGQAEAASKMPSFSLPSASDTSTMINSTQFEGQAMLVTFFATWCGPCREEIPILIKLHEEYKSRGFGVVALSVDGTEGAELVQQLVAKEKITYPVLLADRHVVDGFGGITGVPTSFLINKKGNVVKSYLGMVPHETLADDLELVLR